VLTDITDTPTDVIINYTWAYFASTAGAAAMSTLLVELHVTPDT